MKKKNTLTFVICLFIILLILAVEHIDLSKNDDFLKHTKETTKSEKLKLLLLESTYFKDSKIEIDVEKEILTIDGQYTINIKSGSYMMNISDPKLEEGYCKIVDSIETSLGLPSQKSIETCEKTLAGIIEIGGISAEIYDTHKILTVNSEEPAKLYDITREHKENELISIDEINYNINIDDYLFTSMSTNLKESLEEFSICGHVYNEKNKSQKFNFKIYDQSKKMLNEKTFQFENDKKNYLPFCVNYETSIDNIKYYSIEVQND